MKLAKIKATELSRLVKLLDEIGVQYLKADVTARDKEENREIETVVLMGSFVFGKKDGKYLFSGPTVMPGAVNNANHKPEPSKTVEGN